MLFEDTYSTIAVPSEGHLRNRGSRFVALAFPVKKEAEVKALLQQIKKDHSQANHHCYAFRLTPDTSIFRMSDDREPAGSAGRPILNAILSAQLTDLLIIVVRYFGGTLLGVPGLINAYREAAAAAIKNAAVIQKTINEKFSITGSYSLLNEIYLLLRMSEAQITAQAIGESCTIEFEIRKSLVAGFEDRYKKNHVLNSSTILENIV